MPLASCFHEHRLPERALTFIPREQGRVIKPWRCHLRPSFIQNVGMGSLVGGPVITIFKMMVDHLATPDAPLPSFTFVVGCIVSGVLGVFSTWSSHIRGMEDGFLTIHSAHRDVDIYRAFLDAGTGDRNDWLRACNDKVAEMGLVVDMMTETVECLRSWPIVGPYLPAYASNLLVGAAGLYRKAAQG